MHRYGANDMADVSQYALRNLCGIFMRAISTLLLAVFLAPLPFNAGLLDAEIEVSREFDAWRGKRKNGCKVIFPPSNKLMVNGKDGITKDQQ